MAQKVAGFGVMLPEPQIAVSDEQYQAFAKAAGVPQFTAEIRSRLAAAIAGYEEDRYLGQVAPDATPVHKVLNQLLGQASALGPSLDLLESGEYPQQAARSGISLSLRDIAAGPTEAERRHGHTKAMDAIDDAKRAGRLPSATAAFARVKEELAYAAEVAAEAEPTAEMDLPLIRRAVAALTAATRRAIAMTPTPKRGVEGDPAMGRLVLELHAIFAAAGGKGAVSNNTDGPEGPLIDFIAEVLKVMGITATADAIRGRLYSRK
jgi:hypothetical protein